MATDCYVVLGVPRDASIGRIRKAFHRFCRQYDPDSIDADVPQFRRAFEAFETLTNPNRRLHHDLALHGASRQETEPEDGFESLTGAPVHLLHSFETHHPGRTAIVEQFARNVLPHGEAKARAVRPLNVEITIHPDAARRGGRVPIDVPIARLCERCQGTGSTGAADCDDCDAHGLHWNVARVDVLLSPPVKDGTVVPVSLTHLGVRNLYLRVRVQVVPQGA